MGKKHQRSEAAPRKRWPIVLLVLFIMAAVAAAAVLWYYNKSNVRAYRHKAALLSAYALGGQNVESYGADPAGEDAGYVVFISVCDTTERAHVYSGTGATVADAWDAAVSAGEVALRKSGMDPVWVKADVVTSSQAASMDALDEVLADTRENYFFYGVALDSGFDTALLEAELNGASIYDYENGCIDLDELNSYLEAAGRPTVAELPEDCTLFRTAGWFCDENEQVWTLSSSGYSYGRRITNNVDDDYIKEIIYKSSDWLVNQQQEDGSFIYGYYASSGARLTSYNILRHTTTIWSLLCRWQLDEDESVKTAIDKAIEYMLTQVVYDDAGRAYLYEAKSDEIKLGGGGVATIMLSEYMNVFGVNDEYLEVCRALGEGILSMMDQETGTYYHVLNGDFTPKEEYRTVYYDGEATFALCRLYGLTGEQKWLDAACAAVDHFIEADYIQYRDHWVAYAMNEIISYVPDRIDYYVFALYNAQDNIEQIYNRDTTYPTYLELLMSAFEVYDRLIQLGAQVDGFDADALILTIYRRASRQLDGFLYPELAMYMADPGAVADTFAVRHDGFRIRIDDVQHNIGGYYLYLKNYDRLAAYGGSAG